MYVEYRSASRGYQICVEEDLFGCFILYRRWFGLSNRRGGSKKQVFFNKDEAIKDQGIPAGRAPARAARL